MLCIQDTLKFTNVDDANVAGKVSMKLKYKRKTATLKQAVGAVVTQFRVERGWSQAELSDRSGYGRSWISQLENGKINPTIELVIVLADTFHLKLSQFFARAERKHLKRPRAAPASGRRKKKTS
jgi:DNA-binding XRE family transcriptional regulator